MRMIGPAPAPTRVRERGSIAVETVLLAPVFLLFLMFLAGAGRLVQAQGEVNGAARDAARAASVQRDHAGAENAAAETARQTLDGSCASSSSSLAGTEWAEGGQVIVTVICDLDLSFLGFGASRRLTGDAVAPLETFRRVE